MLSKVYKTKIINMIKKASTQENIQNYYQKFRHYVFAYLEGIPGGCDLEKQVKE